MANAIRNFHIFLKTSLMEIHVLVVTVELRVKLKPPPDWHWLCILRDWSAVGFFSFLQISNQPLLGVFLFPDFNSSIDQIFPFSRVPKIIVGLWVEQPDWHWLYILTDDGSTWRWSFFPFCKFQINHRLEYFPPCRFQINCRLYFFPFSRFLKIIVGLWARPLVWHWLCNLTDDGSTSYSTFKISCWFLVVLIWTPKSLTFIR